MSFSFFSNRRTTAQQDQSPQDTRHYAVPKDGGSQGFLVVSALIHIAAVVVLMHSWSGGIRNATAQTNTASSGPQQPAARRLSIDIAPVQFCDMEIEKIVSRPHAESSR
jgi:hypothetical protein